MTLKILEVISTFTFQTFFYEKVNFLDRAALGYLTGRQVVNNYHRYSKLKAPQQNKNTVTFNLGYSYGHLMPGLIYKFK